MEFIEPLDIPSCIVAIVCGFMIGLERQIKGRPAGIRTSVLVCLGAYTFVVISQNIVPENSPTRVIGQVVTGVGFLGGGMILNKKGLVHGVTSAAIIWLLAGIGCLIGIGKLSSAIFLSTLALCILWGATLLEFSVKKIKNFIHNEEEEEEEDFDRENY